MSATLSNDDSCAVDLLLDRERAGSYGVAPCFSNEPSAVVEARLSRLENLLHLLDHYTTAEPAADMAARTVAFCESRPAAAVRPSEGDTTQPPLAAAS